MAAWEKVVVVLEALAFSAPLASDSGRL